MIVQFHPEAVEELDCTIEYYNNLQENLGLKFYKEFLNSLELIKLYPKTWPRFTKKTRKIIIAKFPYALVYVYNKESLTILAVMNAYRKPGYWKQRLS